MSRVSGVIDPVPEYIRSKFVNLYGEHKAGAAIRQFLNESDLLDAHSPAAQLAFGNAPLRRGGVLAAIGRSIRVQAYLHGAEARDSSRPAPSGTERR